MIDTHCHIDLYDAPIAVAQAAESKRVTTVAVTYLPSHFELARKHLGSFRYVQPALGLHPLAAKDHKKELPLFCKLLQEVAFVGEIGLDFSSAAKETRQIQEESFSIVVDSLRGRKCFITLHSRSAEDAVLSALSSAGVGPVVFHWFSGSKKQMSQVLDAGHYLSLNTAMIRTAKWKGLVTFVPKTSILTESDGPFVRVGDKPAEPSDMNIVLSWLAEHWQISPDEASDQVEQNYSDLLPRTARGPNGE